MKQQNNKSKNNKKKWTKPEIKSEKIYEKQTLACNKCDPLGGFDLADCTFPGGS